jgi:hypothetical protein
VLADLGLEADFLVEAHAFFDQTGQALEFRVLVHQHRIALQGGSRDPGVTQRHRVTRLQAGGKFQQRGSFMHPDDRQGLAGGIGGASGGLALGFPYAVQHFHQRHETCKHRNAR